MSEETSKKYYDYISVGNRTKQTSYFVQQHDKNKMFEALVKTMGDRQILVLLKSKKSADKLKDFLKEKEIESLAIHGNHRVSKIEDAQTAFNEKKIQILITTNGIFETLTLSGVQTLVNYDLPFEETDYFKSLRLVDEVGEAISFIDPEDEMTLATIETMMKCEMNEVEMQGFEHTNRALTEAKDRTKKPRHKKVQQRAKRKAEIKSKWVPTESPE